MAKATHLVAGEHSIMVVRESFWVMLPKWVFTLTLYWWWWRRKQLEVTNHRIIYRAGLFSTKERSVELEHILDVEVRRSLWGRIWGYGRIELETAASHHAEFHFGGVRRPVEFRDAVMAAKEARRQEIASLERAEMARAIATAQAAQQ